MYSNTGQPMLTISQCECGKAAVLSCNSTNITKGDNYVWMKDGALIYDNINNGNVLNGYLGSSTNGSLVLVILQTDASDNGGYRCDHNFMESNQAELSPTCN